MHFEVKMENYLVLMVKVDRKQCFINKGTVMGPAKIW